MRAPTHKLLLLLIFSAIALGAWAVVSEYSFTSALGTYTEISGGTIHGTAANDNENFLAIPLGFTFTYNGVNYNEVSIQTNGFVAMGPVVATSNVAISAATGTNNIVAALNRDIKSRDTGELMSLSSGSAPNRVFTVQWSHYKRVPTTTANDDFSFQIQLHENSNQVRFVYGAFSTVTAATAASIQVGLRGDSNADFNNRTTSTDWSATAAGTANNNNCTLSATVFPASGLTFTFAPAAIGEPPLAAQNPNPANNAINVPRAANLSWAAGGGTTDGYKVFLGTDNPPTNLANGTVQTATTFDPADFTYNTMYYWKIVPFNTNGDAVNCPVWSFTTLADPTVTVYPYLQNFDTVTAPALPVGWTAINANADTYTWESYAGNADTAPNSMRIRYSTTLAMDDWLLTPPLQFTMDRFYKVKFFYRSNSATYPEQLSVYWGTAPNAAAMTNLIFENLAITNITYNMAEVVIPVTTTGTVYIGFHGHSAVDMFYLYMDTFSVTELTDTIDPPTELTATVVNNTNVHLAWTAPGETPPPPVGFVDGFETYPDFSLTFAPWTLVDVDLSGTYGMTGITWLNSYAPMAFMIFNPSATVPPVTDLLPHSGAKMAASFASTTPPNNDWMITPQLTIAAGDEISFWAKSYTAQYGLERFKVGVSTTGTAPANFTIISGASYVSAPVDWTEYIYSLSAYAGQQVYLGIQCLSNDAFIFVVDDVFVGTPANRASYPVVASVSGSSSRNVGTPVFTTPQPATREQIGYKVYRDDVLIHTITNAATVSYDDMALAVGTYSYKVTAIYDSGESVPAGPVTAVIAPAALPPYNLAATVAGNDVTLNWTSPEAPAVGNWITWANDVLGNGIGTGGAFNFDVAHRWPVADLVPYAGGSITQVKFVPNDAACTYTMKIWTGGSATSSGTLVYSQLITAPVIGEWNLHVLNTPVPIPVNGEVYVGFNCNATAGYPAGCDNGPVIAGKGNMIYSDGEWAQLTDLAPTLTYNWLIQAFVAENPGMKAIELKPIAEQRTANNNLGTAVLAKDPNAQIRENNRALTGFKVYRDAVLVGTINDPTITTFTEMDLPNATYVYGVSAVYTTGESVQATTTAIVNVQLSPAFFTDGFESYDNFSLLFAPWTLLDQDLSETYGITDVTFPGSAGPMAYIIFNPSATTPPIASLVPHGGAKMAASFAATTPPNNDWMITPRVHLGTGSAVKFYAKSHTAQYGLERFRVGVSTLPNIYPQGFQYVSGPDFVEAPVAWGEFVYDLSAYDNQSVYITIRCVSNDAFVFYVDDFSIHSVGGYVANEDPMAPVLTTALKGNYPNPFNPETTISFSVKENIPVTIEVYNVKGQRVKTLLNESKAPGDHSVVWKGLDDNNRPVSSGVYFFKMNAGKFSSTKKMIMMK